MALISTSLEKHPNFLGSTKYFTSRNFFRLEYSITSILKNSARSTLVTCLLYANTYLSLAYTFTILNQGIDHMRSNIQIFLILSSKFNVTKRNRIVQQTYFSE